MIEFAPLIADKLKIRTQQVDVVLTLLAEGATIPFIARYRKDKTGALDEVVIQQIQDEFKSMKAFAERKTAIEKSIREQDKMTEVLQQKLDNALTLVELEDIYLPYKPKRKTKAQAAREKGLESLALLILEQKPINLQEAAAAFLKEEIKTTDEALQGARDIIAEMVNEKESVRAAMRKLFEESGRIESKVLASEKKRRPSNSKTILISQKKFLRSLRTGYWPSCADSRKDFSGWKLHPPKKKRCC